MVTRILPPGGVLPGAVFEPVTPVAPSPPAPPFAAPPPAELLVTLCPGERPLALLPVRLETRFFAGDNGSFELRVRVYPDKVHIDAHEPELTPTERDWAQHHWRQHWLAGHDAKREADAWRQLAQRYGAERAAWLRRQLRPRNGNAQPEAPLPAEAVLPIPPRFPEVALANDGENAAWRHAPQARALPDRWIAVACLASGVVASFVFGRDVRQPLAVGPAPQDTVDGVGDLPDDDAAVDAGMRWMIDFDEAEAAGMALRLAVSPALAETGIATLLVFGAKASQDAADAATELQQLLDAHQHTDGLAFLRTGTPTNNTAEARSGYTPDAAGASRANAAIPDGDAALAAPESNARTLAAALGLSLSADGLAAASGAAARHGADQRAMNAALWPVSWGYYLGNMVGFEGTGLTTQHIAWAREHFTGQVRAFGSLPALRLGKQPYGILPVTLLNDWQPPPGAELAHAPDQWLRGLLLNLRQTVWRAQLPAVPHIGRSSEPDSDLAEVMRSDALAAGYAVRPLFGRHYFEHLRAFMGENLRGNGFIDTQQALALAPLQQLNLPQRPRLMQAVFGDTAWSVAGALVQDGEVSPWQALQPDYAGALLAATHIDDIAAAPAALAAAGTPPSLLHALLRHAMLLETTQAAAAVLQSQGVVVEPLLRDRELVNLPPGSPPTPTWKTLLDQKAPAVTQQQTLREFIETQQRTDLPALAPLGAFRAALARLQTLDSEMLQQQMQGTLDLASHRLDAWITSFASKRLAALRGEHASGLHLGGYGWVHDLRPTRVAAVPVAPPAGESAPLVAQADDSGFIHAPSMAHAATAALLRNGHLGHSGVAAAEGPFAIDLSSQRLRDARWLLDGVRQGQPLAALLGYRFERRLHELRLDRFVAELRELAPLVGGKLQASDAPLEQIAANNVVDGLSLWQQWKTQGDALFAGPQSNPKLPKPTLGAPYQALTRELDALGESIDAVSDALTAESAYQMVRGNVACTASTLAAVAGGDAPVPELDVARTPRSGIGLTHRVLLAFSGKAGATTGWAPVSASPRAAAEPLLNGWAAQLIGDPRKIVCEVRQFNAAGALVLTHLVPLSVLKLAPLDFVYGVDAEVRHDQASEVEQRLLHHLRSSVAGIAPGDRLQIVADAAAAPTQLSLADALVQARHARRLFAVGRGIDAGDLALPEQAVDAGVDLVELTARCSKAEKALLAAHKALLPVTAPTAAARRAAIIKLAGFGIPSAMPVLASGDDDATRAALALQAKALARETQARLDAGAALRALPAADSVPARRDRLLERLRAVFGAGFAVLPRFACAEPAELAGALARSVECQGGDALAAHAWLVRAERVRDGVARLGDVLRGAEVLGTGAQLHVDVAQLPVVAGERWVGLAPAPGTSIAAGRLSLVVHAGSKTLDCSLPMAGLQVDEWVEVVPNRNETTALAFQFNPPDACAPQAILLAVPAVMGRAWTPLDMARLLLDTLELAKLRAVDPEALGALGHYLPALTLAFNANGDAVSTDFAALTRPGHG